MPQSYPNGVAEPGSRSKRDRENSVSSSIMKLRYVIDNQTYVLTDILKGLLTEGQSGTLLTSWTNSASRGYARARHEF